MDAYEGTVTSTQDSDNMMSSRRQSIWSTNGKRMLEDDAGVRPNWEAQDEFLRGQVAFKPPNAEER